MALFQGANDKNQQVTPQKGRVKSVLRYTMMPEILPRIRALGFHFGHFAYLLALVFASARLIPQTHPVINTANIGRFGVRQVIAIAANNIIWSTKNIDQIAIFSAIIIGLIMIVIQAGLIAFAALVGFNPAEASGVSFFTPDPTTYTAANDPMMVFFSQVFGDLNGFWGANVWSNGSGATRIHNGIYAMLSLYSMAMMVIAVIIVIYYIMTIVGEAAKTGTPFGQRFNSLWAPIRLVVALGLLVPLGNGLNSAQYITLWTAKMGSGLGTQIWMQMIEAMDGDNGARYVLDDFKTPWVRELTYQVFILETCKQAQNKFNGRSADVNPSFQEAMGGQIRKIAQENSGMRMYKHHYQTVGYPNNGIADSVLQTYPEYPNMLQGYCGSININFSDAGTTGSMTYDAASVPIDDVYQLSKTTIINVVNDADLIALAKDYAYYNITPNGGSIGTFKNLDNIFQELNIIADKHNDDLLVAGGAITTEYSADITRMLQERKNSWVYAGIWYLEIGRMIQAGKDLEANAIPNTTSVGTRDDLISRGVNANPLAEAGIDPTEVLPLLAKIKSFYSSNASAYVVPPANNDLAVQKCDGLKDRIARFGVNESDNWLEKGACLIFSLVVPEELVLLARINAAAALAPVDLDPMASLIGAGYTITQRAWSYILMGFGAKAGGALISYIPYVGGIIGSLAAGMGSIMILLGTLGIAAGLVPVMPFIYFFFAIVSWIMEIFEAVVAMPLWALAHLKIEGDGMPGAAAINGYYLLLAILLRPALIVIGLIAGSVIFGASIYLLQTLFYKAIIVKSAGSTTGLETLIYVVVFTYVAYMAATTSFKLVDRIPDSILRWIGSGAQTFSDGKEDPMGRSEGAMSAAGAVIGGQIAGNIGGAGTNVGQGLGKALFKRNDPLPPEDPRGKPGAGDKGGGTGGQNDGNAGPAREPDRGADNSSSNGGSSSDGGDKMTPGGFNKSRAEEARNNKNRPKK
jgi:hypothetical protein